MGAKTKEEMMNINEQTRDKKFHLKKELWPKKKFTTHEKAMTEEVKMEFEFKNEEVGVVDGFVHHEVKH